jgi:PKHD-type hydroxylase
MYDFSEVLSLSQNDYLHEPLIFPEALTEEQCDAWVKQLLDSRLEIVKGDLQEGDDGEIDTSIRIVEKREFYDEDEVDIEIVAEVFLELESIFMSANSHFEFDVRGINESVNLLHYKHFPEGAGHYIGHTDFGEGLLSTRKLTCIIQLSSVSSYTGCDLVLPDYGEDIPKEKGTAIVFPSYMYHLVKPILNGERYCINAWATGPPFK